MQLQNCEPAFRPRRAVLRRIGPPQIGHSGVWSSPLMRRDSGAERESTSSARDRFEGLRKREEVSSSFAVSAEKGSGRASWGAAPGLRRHRCLETCSTRAPSSLAVQAAVHGSAVDLVARLAEAKRQLPRRKWHRGPGKRANQQMSEVVGLLHQRRGRLFRGSLDAEPYQPASSSPVPHSRSRTEKDTVMTWPDYPTPPPRRAPAGTTGVAYEDRSEKRSGVSCAETGVPSGSGRLPGWQPPHRPEGGCLHAERPTGPSLGHPTAARRDVRAPRHSPDSLTRGSRSRLP
jgi:hypothetical protein